MALSCGIDFGTSNSAFAVARAGDVFLTRVEGSDITLPSTVFYGNDQQAPLFGRCAMNAFVEREEGRFMRSLKRMLGTSLMGQGTIVNGRKKAFEAIVHDFISHIKSKAEEQCGASLENVVMGRPVYFVDNDDNANHRAQDELEKIAKSAGFKNIEFQYEPIAAAFTHERKLSSEKLALVVDIGGGTSDFTVIRLSPQGMNKVDRKADILANAGVRIGGNDFDKDLCLDIFMPILGYKTNHGDKNISIPIAPFHELSQWSKVNFLYTAKSKLELENIYKQAHEPEKFGRFLKIIDDETGHQLLAVVEESKINLTIDQSTQAHLSFVEPDLKIKITRKAFDQAVKKHVLNINHMVSDCLAQAGVTEKEIELIILTGGTTEVPIIKETIQKRFSQAIISQDNKLASVGLGLGYDSARRF
jgi:hypothetical chaperone protein